MKVSIIIPVYNVSQYLKYSIESLMKQTYQNFEVILVNDGSTDNSGELCDVYAEKYVNVFSYHKKNGGLSDARNFGIDKSNSEWIVFLDPDDYLEEYALELMVKIQKYHQADMVATKIKTTQIYNDYSSYKLNELDIENAILMTSSEAYFDMLYENNSTVSACGKLFYKKIFDKIRFPKGKIYEDLFIIAECLKVASTIVISPVKTYNYYQRENSIVNSEFNNRKFDFFKAIERNREIIKECYNDDPLLNQALDAKLAVASNKLIKICVLSQRLDKLEEIKSKLKSIKKSFIFNPYIAKKPKIKYLLFLISPRLTAKFIKYSRRG